MFQFIRQDEDNLWVVADILVKNKQFKEAKTLIKFMVEKAFTARSLPDMENTFSNVIATADPIDDKLIERMKQLNEQLRELTEQQDDLNAKIAVVEYIDTLSEALGNNELRKKLLASLIDLPSKEDSSTRSFYLKSRKATTSDLKAKKPILQRDVAPGKSEEPAEPFVSQLSETYSLKEASEIMGVSDKAVRRLCENGKFPEATQIAGGDWKIPKHYFKMTLQEARTRRQKMMDQDDL